MSADPNRPVDPALAERLYRKAKARRWRLDRSVFTATLETSFGKAFPEGDPGLHEASRYFDSLHLEDLALACACAQELSLDAEKTNPNGGAIALGHPVGATGAILTVKMMHELERIDGRFGLVSLCIGGGQGIATIFERVN